MVIDSEKLTLTVAEVGAKLGLSKNLTYQLINTGKIPSIRFGKRLLVPKKRLDELLSGSWPAERQ